MPSKCSRPCAPRRVRAYTYICVYIYIYIYIYTCVCVCMYALEGVKAMCTTEGACLHPHTNIIYIYIHIYIYYLFIYLRARIYICICVYMPSKASRPCAPRRVRAYTYIAIYLFVYIMYVHVYIHIYIHICVRGRRRQAGPRRLQGHVLDGGCVHTHLSIFVCVCVCKYVHIYTYMYVYVLYIYIHKHIYTLYSFEFTRFTQKHRAPLRLSPKQSPTLSKPDGGPRAPPGTFVTAISTIDQTRLWQCGALPRRPLLCFVLLHPSSRLLLMCVYVNMYVYMYVYIYVYFIYVYMYIDR